MIAGLLWRYGPTVAVVLALAGGGWWGVNAIRSAGYAACVADVAAQNAKDYTDQRRVIDALPPVPADPDTVLDRLRGLAF